jgi:AcrR family transcriptional regulator
MAHARAQIAAEVAAALSLRAIARAMDMTAPAIYRYFPSRDDLLTALILETYTTLGDTLQSAVDQCDPHDHRAKFLAFTKAYRQWALAHPQDYILIFTTSVPGYDAPDEITQPAAARLMTVFINIVVSAAQDGAMALPDELVAESDSRIGQAEQRYEHPNQSFKFGLIGWTRIHGVISLEIFNHLEPIIGTADELYDAEVMTLLTALGLDK